MKESMSNLIKKIINDKIIDESYSEKILDIMYEEKGHLKSYKILTVPFEEVLVEITDTDIKSFYHDARPDMLNEVDYVILRLLKTLDNLTGENVTQEYESSITLDKNEPELEFLIQKVDSILFPKKKWKVLQC